MTTRLEQFRATRSTTRVVPDELRPSDAPASVEYSYEWRNMIWWIRREGSEYVFDWCHPCNRSCSSLSDAEQLLFLDIEAEHDDPIKVRIHDVEDEVTRGECSLDECFPDRDECYHAARADLLLSGRALVGGGAAPLFVLTIAE